MRKFGTYSQYLRSEDWRLKRSKLNLSHCHICGSSHSIQAHHLNYRNLVDVRTSDLVPLCQRCHTLAHKLLKKRRIIYRSEDGAHRLDVTKRAIERILGLNQPSLISAARVGGLSRQSKSEKQIVIERLLRNNGLTDKALAILGVERKSGWRSRLPYDFSDEKLRQLRVECGFKAQIL